MWVLEDLDFKLLFDCHVFVFGDNLSDRWLALEKEKKNKVSMGWKWNREQRGHM